MVFFNRITSWIFLSKKKKKTKTPNHKKSLTKIFNFFLSTGGLFFHILVVRISTKKILGFPCVCVCSVECHHHWMKPKWNGYDTKKNKNFADQKNPFTPFPHLHTMLDKLKRSKKWKKNKIVTAAEHICEHEEFLFFQFSLVCSFVICGWWFQMIYDLKCTQTHTHCEHQCTIAEWRKKIFLLQIIIKAKKHHFVAFACLQHENLYWQTSVEEKMERFSILISIFFFFFCHRIIVLSFLVFQFIFVISLSTSFFFFLLLPLPSSSSSQHSKYFVPFIFYIHSLYSYRSIIIWTETESDMIIHKKKRLKFFLWLLFPVTISNQIVLLSQKVRFENGFIHSFSIFFAMVIRKTQKRCGIK